MQTQNPLVSIIVPNYNYSRYLESRLESIFNQTFTDYEVILLDDASTDGSTEILEKYRNHPKVSQCILNEKNSGSPFKQWMKGLSLAKGKWIWIAEADDLAEPQFLGTCMKYAADSVSIVYTGSKLIDKDNNPINDDFNMWYGRDCVEAARFPGVQYAEHDLYWRNRVFNASGVVFSKEKALLLQDEHFLQMRNCGDWLFWFRMSLLGDVVEVYKILNIYRYHASQTQKGFTSGNLWSEAFHVLLDIESYLHTISNYKKRLCHARWYQQIRRLKDKKLKKSLRREYRRLFHSIPEVDYYFYKLNLLFDFMPFILTEEKDRLR